MPIASYAEELKRRIEKCFGLIRDEEVVVGSELANLEPESANKHLLPEVDLVEAERVSGLPGADEGCRELTYQVR